MHLLGGICCVRFLLSPMGVFFKVFPQVVALKLAQWVSF